MKIVIPARKNSKGLPGKNRMLFEPTAISIPSFLSSSTIVTTDDELIIEHAKNKLFSIHNRDSCLADDNTSIRDVVESVISDFRLASDELIVLLYLTYPQRTWYDVERALHELQSTNSRSLLCSFDLDVSPYLMAYHLPNSKAKQVIKHDLYRRQDYPACVEISHFVCMFYADEVRYLNKNMYNDNTHFMKCSKKIDVDLPEHLDLLGALS
jgi:CMP-N-acetylneuraminic acid synthetase